MSNRITDSAGVTVIVQCIERYPDRHYGPGYSFRVWGVEESTGTPVQMRSAVGNWIAVEHGEDPKLAPPRVFKSRAFKVGWWQWDRIWAEKCPEIEFWAGCE